jgi:hypothetical protein
MTKIFILSWTCMCLEVKPLLWQGRSWSFCVGVSATFVPLAAAKFLLALASKVILASESQGTHDILLSDGSGSVQTSGRSHSSQSQSYIRTNDQSASLSWNKASI